jgi:hypothetical protein
VPLRNETDTRIIYGRVERFYSIIRSRAPLNIFDDLPYTLDNFFVGCDSLLFAIISEIPTIEHARVPRLRYSVGQQRSKLVVLLPDISCLIGFIELDRKYFVVDRQDSRIRNNENYNLDDD